MTQADSLMEYTENQVQVPCISVKGPMYATEFMFEQIPFSLLDKVFYHGRDLGCVSIGHLWKQTF